MSKISNYNELLAERKKLEGRISEQKLVVQEGLHELKQKLEPFLYLLPILNIFNKKQSGPTLLKSIASVGLDLIVGRNALSKSSTIASLLVPMLAKGLSSLVQRTKRNSNTEAVPIATSELM